MKRIYYIVAFDVPDNGPAAKDTAEAHMDILAKLADVSYTDIGYLRMLPEDIVEDPRLAPLASLPAIVDKIIEEGI